MICCDRIFLLPSICSEVLTAVGGYPGTGPRVVHPQVFLPLPRSNSPLYKGAVGTPTHTLLSSVSIHDSFMLTIKLHCRPIFP